MSEAVAVGLIVPINNTTMEGELLAWLPPGSRASVKRVPRGKGTLTHADLPAYKAATIELARSLADEPLDLVVYGCTAAGFLSGPAGDAEVAGRLAEVTGRPTVTTASSMVAALKAGEAERISVVTPYRDMLNGQLTAFLNESGVEVLRLNSFHAGTTDELAAITSEMVAGLARETAKATDDALFIACSQLPTRAIVAPLRAETGIPVWSSIMATAWQARRTLGRFDGWDEGAG